jgi:hypothetical protein
MSSTFLTLHPENINVASGLTVVDLATGANAGDVVHMDYWGECLVLLVKEAGAAGEPPIITVEQTQEIGGTPKALTIRGGSYVKKGANLQAVGDWTKTAMTTANTLNLTAGDTEAIVAMHIRSADLDMANGYNCIKVSVAKTGATAGQLGTLLYIMGSPRYTPPPSVLAD